MVTKPNTRSRTAASIGTRGGSDLAGISESALQELIAAGEISTVASPNKSVRVSMRSLNRWIAEHNQVTGGNE